MKDSAPFFDLPSNVAGAARGRGSGFVRLRCIAVHVVGDETVDCVGDGSGRAGRVRRARWGCHDRVVDDASIPGFLVGQVFFHHGRIRRTR